VIRLATTLQGSRERLRRIWEAPWAISGVRVTGASTGDVGGDVRVEPRCGGFGSVSR
jgi:hypothetical protein